MARRTKGFARFIRPAPKTKIWIASGIPAATITTNAKVLMTVLNAAALALRPFTILRTRVFCTFLSDQGAASEVPTGAYGKIIVKETASAIGVTAVPGPLTEADADWFVYQGMTSHFDLATAVGFNEPGGQRFDIDSKAMRKVGPTDDLVSVFEARATGGAFLNIEGRTLIQLH